MKARGPYRATEVATRRCPDGPWERIPTRRLARQGGHVVVLRAAGRAPTAITRPGRGWHRASGTDGVDWRLRTAHAVLVVPTNRPRASTREHRWNDRDDVRVTPQEGKRGERGSAHARTTPAGSGPSASETELSLNRLAYGPSKLYDATMAMIWENIARPPVFRMRNHTKRAGRA